MISLKEITEVLGFERESVILGIVVGLLGGIAFEMGSDLYSTIKPYIIKAWKLVKQKLLHKSDLSEDSQAGSSPV